MGFPAGTAGSRHNRVISETGAFAPGAGRKTGEAGPNSATLYTTYQLSRGAVAGHMSRASGTRIKRPAPGGPSWPREGQLCHFPAWWCCRNACLPLTARWMASRIAVSATPRSKAIVAIPRAMFVRLSQNVFESPRSSTAGLHVMSKGKSDVSGSCGRSKPGGAACRTATDSVSPGRSRW